MPEHITACDPLALLATGSPLPRPLLGAQGKLIVPKRDF
jgi:hypothetical protein